VVAPKMEGDAAPDCSAGLAPKVNGVVGVDFSSGFAPKRGLVGDGLGAELSGLLNTLFPPKVGGGAGVVPLPKINGFDAVLLLASGEVCIESSEPVDCPKMVGLSEVDWPKIFVEVVGAGAGLETLVCPKKPAPLVAGVAPAEGPEVAPKRPPEGAGLAGARLKMFPLNPPKPPPSVGWLGAAVLTVANGLLAVVLGPAAKLKEGPPLPPPKENGDDVPFVPG
jgi:hypothetical protein